MSIPESSNYALEKRRIELGRKQRLMRHAAMKRAEHDYSALLRSKIPAGTRDDLEWAFGLGFSLVFDQGEALIKKTLNGDKLSKKYLARHIALTIDGDDKQFQSSRQMSNAGNMLMTTIEGLGLGALGIGIPDILLFVAMLLRGVYETAAEYGFGCDSREEKLYILSLMECAMLSGTDWIKADARVDELAEPDHIPGRAEIQQQAKRTAAAFAADLLIIKFIQGLPIVGLIGGLGNPVYYRRVISYAELKYQQRYLKKIIENKKDKED